MTTIPKLRTRLRKGKIVKNTPETKRDPTFASKQISNYARMPYILRTGNTYHAPPALYRILRGDVSQARAINKDPHRDQATSELKMQVGNGSRNSHSDGDGCREECDYYKRTMRDKKGCGTNTAPPGPKRTTLSDNCDDQPPDPKAEGMKLAATSRSNEDGGFRQCR